jgi:hypothetical protein
MHPSPTRAQVYQVDEPCYDIGEVPHQLVSMSKILCGISRAIQVVLFQHLEMSIKNVRFKPQPSTPMQAFASMRSTPFTEIDDKGGEIVQKYESFGREMDKEEAALMKVRGIKIFGREKHTSRGSKLMNLFDCI